MNKPGILLTVIILALATVTPMAASPVRDAATAPPTPIMPAATPTPVVVKPLDASGRYEPQEMEEVRQALLDIVDVLNELYPYAETYARVSGAELPPRLSRQLIQGLTHQELYMARESFGTDFERFRNEVRSLKSLLLTPESRSDVEDKGPQPSPDVFRNLASSSTPPLTSIGIIPAPTPVTTPPPGIQHDTAHVEQVNEDLDDFSPPDYWWGCPTVRYDPSLMLTEMILVDIEKLAAFMADIITCNATLFVVCLPFGGGTNVPGCIASGIIKGIGLVAESILEGLNFCIGEIDYQEIVAALDNTERLHAELHMHDQNLTTRFNWTDNDLFHFRNLNLRSRIEDNLASPEDDPIALFTLPSAICITTDLEVISANNPKFSSGRIAGCGLLEVVSDTVRSAIDMNQIAGQDINNAWAEFDAAVAHYDAQEWKLAYARFRKAYREAVRP